MKLVIDASVALKWVLGDSPDEQDQGRARQLLIGIVMSNHALIQPPHWLDEVVSVLARRDPSIVPESLSALNSIGFETDNADTSLIRAAELATQLKQHVFDTHYHAIALLEDATLITADARYYSAAHGEGSIELLSSFSLS